METNVAAATVKVVEPPTLPELAEIVDVPTFRADATPAVRRQPKWE